MTGPFRALADGYRLALPAEEVAVLGVVPAILDRGGDGGRLDYRAHPDDPAAEARFRDLTGTDLERMRVEDRETFEVVRSGEPVSAVEVEAFMRVVGEARLILAAQLGIEEDGWEAGAEPRDPDMALLMWLGYLQDSAVELLSRSL